MMERLEKVVPMLAYVFGKVGAAGPVCLRCATALALPHAAPLINAHEHVLLRAAGAGGRGGLEEEVHHHFGV